jgi:hypothetical protein
MHRERQACALADDLDLPMMASVVNGVPRSVVKT